MNWPHRRRKLAVFVALIGLAVLIYLFVLVFLSPSQQAMVADYVGPLGVILTIGLWGWNKVRRRRKFGAAN